MRPFETQVRRNQWKREIAQRREALARKFGALRSDARRASLEVAASARSSAALSGLQRDSARLAHRLESESAKAAKRLDGAGTRLGTRVKRLTAGAKAAGGRAKRAAFTRSSFLQGLAIDSRRVARRLRVARAARKGRAHA